MDRLQSMGIFVAVVERGSFRGAARQLALSPASVTAHVAELERQLAVQLLHRGTRGLELTDDGLVYRDHCRLVLDEIAQTEARLRGTRNSASGRLSVDAYATAGVHLVLPALREFAERQPGITVDLSLTDRAYDLSADGFDVMLRHGPASNEGLIARPLGDASVFTVASPEYLAAHGEPATPQDLLNHECINLRSPRSGKVIDWVFRRRGEHLAMQVPGRWSMSHNEQRIQAALAGLGLAQAADYAVQALLKTGRLKQVLSDWSPRNSPLLLLYAPHRRDVLKVKAFVDFLLELYPAGRPIMSR